MISVSVHRTLAFIRTEDCTGHWPLYIHTEDCTGHWPLYVQRAAQDTGLYTYRGQHRTLAFIRTEDCTGHWPLYVQRTAQDTGLCIMANSPCGPLY